MRRVIKFNQEAYLKPYIDTNTKQIKMQKNDYEKEFWKLHEKSEKNRDTRLIATEGRRNHLESEPHCHTKIFF